MSSIIKEIINTPSIVIENEPNDDDFPEFARLRRTHTMECIYCDCRWGDVAYDRIVRVRVCYKCKNDIIDKVSERHQNLHLVSETIKNKNRVLEDVIEVGMHPDRVYQTQLVETLFLFRQPSN